MNEHQRAGRDSIPTILLLADHIVNGICQVAVISDILSICKQADGADSVPVSRSWINIFNPRVACLR